MTRSLLLYLTVALLCFMSLGQARSTGIAASASADVQNASTPRDAVPQDLPNASFRIQYDGSGIRS